MYANSKFYPFHPVGYDQIAEIELTVKVIAMANARIHVKLRIVIQIGWSTLFIVAQEIVWSVSTKGQRLRINSLSSPILSIGHNLEKV